LQTGEAGEETALDRRQRHVHDRDVDEEHERRRANRHERPALTALVRSRPVDVCNSGGYLDPQRGEEEGQLYAKTCARCGLHLFVRGR
jgi:hypothetical protein